MKKVLLSAFALIFAMTVFADDLEICNSFTVPSSAVNEELTTVIGSTTNVTWYAGRDTWKASNPSNSTNPAYFTINGQTANFSSGLCGNANPSYLQYDANGNVLRDWTEAADSIKSISSSDVELPDSGGYVKFTVAADGYLYVFGKYNTNKNFVVWEGETRIPYKWVAYDSENTVISYDLSTIEAALDDEGNISTTYKIQTPKDYTSFSTTEDESTALIRFAVKAGQTYTFCGTGTKAAMFGYYFAPAGTDVTIVYTSASATLISETVPNEETGYTLTFDPEDGSEVETLSSIIIKCEDGISYNWGTLTVTDDNGDTFDLGSVDTDDDYTPDTNDDGSDTSVKLVFTNAIETAGTYTISFPESCFILGGDNVADNSDAMEVTYIVTGEAGGGETVTTTNYECYFTGSSTAVTSDDFFTVTHTGSDYSNSQGTVTYNGTTYDYCIHMDSKATIVFTTTEEMTLTLVFSDENGSVKITNVNDGNAVGPETGSTVYTTTLAAGTYTIEKGSNTSTYIFYVSLTSTDNGGSVEPENPGETEGDITEANWDWATGNPSSITSVSIDGKTDYVDSDVDGIQMYVDASNGKLSDNSGNAQFNAGTILRVPVVNVGDTVTVKGYENFGGLKYSVCGSDTIYAETTTTYDYVATEYDAEMGFVQIESLGGFTYLYSVKVTYITAISADDVDMDAIAEAEPDYSTEPDPVVITITSKSDDLTDAETLEQITDGVSSITVTATNMDQYDGAGIYFAITYTAVNDDDEEYTATLTSSWLDADSDGNYTWTCGWGYNLDKDVEYTFSITPKAVKNNSGSEDIGDAVSFTITGTYEAVTATMTADPTDKITADGEAKTITLTFSTAVKVTSAQMSTGTMFNRITEDLTVGENESASTTWTITVSADQMSEAAESGYMSLVIYAEDENGTTVCDADNDNADNFSLYYDIESELAWTFDPEDESTVESLSTIVVTCEDGIAYEDETITITGVDSESQPIDLTDVTVTCADDLTDEQIDNWETATSCTITISPAITTEGTYTITIPESAFYVGGEMDDCPETILTYYVSTEGGQTEPVEYSLTFTPDGTATVDSIATITIVEANGQELALQGWEDDVVVKDALGDTIASGIKEAIDPYDLECEYVLSDEDGTVYGYIVPLDSVITTAGTYYITIPEGFVVYGEGSTTGNDEKTIAVQVSGDASGIKGVTLRATGDDKFYNLNGQRVTSPRNGVFILNGKKVLVK